MKSSKVEALVLKYKNYSEASRLFTLFTKERGKLKAVAKGVRRITSKRLGVLDLLSHVKMTLVETGGLPLITEVSLVDSFDSLKSDLNDLSLSFSVLETLDKFFEEEDLNEQAFVLSLGLLKRAGRLKGLKRDLSFVYYQYKLLILMGLDPILGFCVRCLRDLDFEADAPVFNSNEGGLVCSSCGRYIHGVKLSPESLNLIRLIKSSQFDGLPFSFISPRSVCELEELTKHHIEVSLNETLVSQKILSGVK